jgi:hypothetical protein
VNRRETMFKRYDGSPIKNIKAINRFFPYAMINRCDSVVYSDFDIEVDSVLDYLEKVNKDRPKNDQIKIFDIYLAAIHRLYLERPRLNRFILNRRYYQRNEHLYFFISKREISDDGEERTIGLNLGPRDGLFEVHQKARALIKESKTGNSDKSDEKAVEVLMKFPRFFVKFFSWFMYGFLDQHNLMPGSLAATDSMHGSAYIANLGSFGVNTLPYHHLYNYGDISLFFAIGAMMKKPYVNQTSGEFEVRNVVSMRVTIDERIADGVYFNNSFQLFMDLFQHPEKLEKIPDNAKNPYPGVKMKKSRKSVKKN